MLIKEKTTHFQQWPVIFLYFTSVGYLDYCFC